MTAKAKFNIDAIKKAIEIVGSANKLAVEIKVSSLTAYRWRDGKSVPSPENCLKIEKVTEGKVLAKDIRPDLNWERIREELRNII